MRADAVQANNVETLLAGENQILLRVTGDDCRGK